MSTNYIKKFLEANYNDERLAALQAHCEEKRLSYDSCCCLIGIPTAPHPLQSDFCENDEEIKHLAAGRSLPYGQEAESEFALLGKTDGQRRERLLPLIHAERLRRQASTDAVLIGAEKQLVKG